MKSETLREMAMSQPGATSVFLAYGLDFCCGGARTLAEACAGKGIDPQEVLDAVAAKDPGRTDLTALAAVPLPELTAFIEARYHAKLRSEFPELVSMAQKVERVHAEKATCPKGLAALLQEMGEATFEHLAKEERVLFPMIRARSCGHLQGLVEVMEREHEDHGRALARLRDKTSGFTPPPDACTTWRALYLRLRHFSDELMEHIHLENNVLFPRALCEGVEAR